jgi:signal transduction histidine kinase/DNA-binding response OmpR family regulator/HPt (histidine-containing phosphotransfer) domain-containing protein
MTHFLPRWFHLMSFRRQLTLAVALGVLSTVLLSAVGSAWQGSRQIRDTLIGQGERVTENLARQSRLALLLDSEENAASAVDITLSFPDVIGVEIRHNNGKQLVARGHVDSAAGGRRFVPPANFQRAILEEETVEAWHFVAPVLAAAAADSPFETQGRDTEVLGHVRVVLGKDTLTGMMIDVFVINLTIATFFTLLFLATIRFLTARLTRPLTQLSETMARAERGEPRVRAHLDGPRDIMNMAQAFNSMMTVLEDREQELRAARDEALRFARLKSEFAATVSHEIRTPLNGVIGTLDMLQATNMPARQRQFVGIAWNSARYLLDLVNNILDFSRLEAGKLELEHTEFDIHHLVEETIELFAPQAQQKGLELGYVTDGEVPRQLKGDTRRIRQILANLISNAVKFAESGEIAVRIGAAPHAAGGHLLRLEVIDTGIGIDKQAQSRIFDSFTQADHSTTRRYSGSGLGLAICKQLVGLMGGDIGVDSEPGKGSRFWFTLPLEAVPQAPTASADRARPVGAGRRVLIVDESEIVCHFLRQSLETWGYSCRSVRTAEEASAALRHAALAGAKFDIVILDTVFATAAGGELPLRIRAEPMLRGVRLILMDRYGVEDAATAAQTDAYLAKPLRLDRLLECIATVGGHAAPALSAEAPVTGDGTPAPRVLIVEDNRTNQTVARAMLGMLGLRPEIAENGRDALRACETQSWDLILMDCNMPDMDGYEATRLIRSGEATTGRHTPIVAMTANTQPADVERCLDAGMDDHLAKPLTINSLAESIRRWLPNYTIDVPHAASVREAHTAGGAANPTLDPKVFGTLREVLGKGIGQMIEPFLEDMPTYIEQMNSAIGADDAAKLRRAAHAVKGAASNLGAARLAGIAREIEECAETGSATSTQGLLVRLGTEYIRVKQALQAERTEDVAHPMQNVNEGALVLVVDDDRSTRSALRYALQRGGFRVEEAADGAQALVLVDRTRPDVILMDALMPNMDGFTACTRLQEMPAGKDIPVLMITALEDNHSIERAFAAGARDYISKPLPSATCAIWPTTTHSPACRTGHCSPTISARPSRAPRRASNRWRCYSSTSTASSSSTTRSATRSAIACSRPWPTASSNACAPATAWHASGAMSSPSCSRNCPASAPPPARRRKSAAP